MIEVLDILNGSSVREQSLPPGEQDYAVLVFGKVIGDPEGPKGYDTFLLGGPKGRLGIRPVLWAMTFEGTYDELVREQNRVQKEMFTLRKRSQGKKDVIKFFRIATWSVTANFPLGETEPGSLSRLKDVQKDFGVSINNKYLTSTGVI